MDDVTIARAVHILAVVHWIGGLWFVTSVILPAALALSDPARQLALFHEVERRFSGQVRISVPLAGLSGFYMAWKLGAWERFLDPAAWWLPAMVLLWLLFMVVLFVVEPLFGNSVLNRLSVVQAAHRLLLALAALVVGAAVLGAHGVLG
jgi:uncharacterized membrane protein